MSRYSSELEGAWLWDYVGFFGEWDQANMNNKWQEGNVTEKTGGVAYVRITTKGDYDEKNTIIMWKMAYERDNWYVDDVKVLYSPQQDDGDTWKRQYIQDEMESLIRKYKSHHSN